MAVVDIGMPGTDGLTAAALLNEQCPGCKVLILTVLAKPGNLHQALTAQVAGFLPKEPRPPSSSRRSEMSPSASG